MANLVVTTNGEYSPVAEPVADFSRMYSFGLNRKATGKARTSRQQAAQKRAALASAAKRRGKGKAKTQAGKKTAKAKPASATANRAAITKLIGKLGGKVTSRETVHGAFRIWADGVSASKLKKAAGKLKKDMNIESATGGGVWVEVYRRNKHGSAARAGIDTHDLYF